MTTTTQEDNRKGRLAALLLTLLITAGTVLTLLYTGLHYEYPPRDGELLTQLKQDSILFGGEFVMLGNTPQPTQSEEVNQEEASEEAPDEAIEPAIEGDDMEDAGEPAKQTPPLVTSRDPSPMKVKEKPKEEKPKPAGPAKTNTKPKEEKPKVKQSTETATNNRVRDAFGRGNSGSNSGKQGTASGNASHGALSGKPGIGGLDGYTLEFWGRPHSQWAGTVRVKVRVNNRGKVIQANAVGGSGEAYSHPEVRRSCEQESLKSQFSVPKSTTTEGVGIITWRFV